MRTFILFFFKNNFYHLNFLIVKPEEESSEDLIEIKQKLENSMGTEELQQRINQARTRVSGSISESGSIADRRSLNGSLHR